MRPLRLLLSFVTTVLGITLLLYAILDSRGHEDGTYTPPSAGKGELKSSWSFTSPGSLFPPSAIISLTDDNSTFFLARPAAFGPLLPKDGLSGPLWIGSGFGEESMGRGELGCTDVPGWRDASSLPSMRTSSLFKSTPANSEGSSKRDEDTSRTEHARRNPVDGSAAAQGLHTRSRDVSENTDIRFIQESAEISGKVVLLKRGGCAFSEKALWAQRRGGVALIVGDDVRGGPLIRMYAHGDVSNISIPAIFTSHTTAHLLSSLLPSGRTLEYLSPEEAAHLEHIKNAKDSKKEGSEQSQDTDGGAKATTPPEKKLGWLQSLLHALGFSNSSGENSGTSSNDSLDLDWVVLEHWNGGESGPTKSKAASGPTSVVGNSLPGKKNDFEAHSGVASSLPIGRPSLNTNPDKAKGAISSHHDGLWVTIQPTNISTSPFFDTLLVLVVSPLVTLTVVYALLLLRARIRRRRWRAPKSVVERLPVRTYQTVSDSPPPTATPVTSASSSPTTTTPLLQRTPSRPTSSVSRSHSRPAPEVPTSVSPSRHGRTPEEEKRDSGLAEWRRRYGGRQKECVVCLEEYEDGISQVMSLPCGHEFHVECITPWLVTRRRTCPICKGDVVASLSQSYRDRNNRSSSPIRSPRFFQDDADPFQTQAAETRNDSPSASRPVPISSSSDLYDDSNDDIEANWADGETDENDSRARNNSREGTFDFGSSVRELSSTVQTTIWRGVDAIRGASGRRTNQEEVDRDR